MISTDDDLEQWLRETLHAIGAAAQPPDRLVERLHRAATSAGVAAETSSPQPDDVTSLHPPVHLSRRTPAARWAPLLAVAAVIAILAVGGGGVAVNRSRTTVPSLAASQRPAIHDGSTISKSVKTSTSPRLQAVCGDEMGFYGVQVDNSSPQEATAATSLLSGTQAITIAMLRVPMSQFHTGAFMEASPATVSALRGQSFDTSASPDMNHRPMWAVLYGGLDVAYGHSANVPGAGPSIAPSTPPELFAHHAIDFIDPASGKIAFTMFCR